MKSLSDSEKKLFAALNEGEKETFKQFTDAQAEASILSGVDRFIYGYRLGVLMTMEVFNGRDDLIVGGEAVE